MSKFYTFLVVEVFITFNTTFVYSANVSVRVTVTKTAHLDMPEINEIVNKVNTTELSGALQANYSLPDKQNLVVHMVFYHQKYIGALELKNINTLTTDQYVQAWKTTNHTGNHILFLFTWNESNNLYEHKKLEVSPEMENYHLFTEVMNFIRTNLNGNSAGVVEKGTRYLANAIRPVWTIDKRDQAEALLENKKYHKGHYIDYFGQPFFDFRPVSQTSDNKVRLYCSNHDASEIIETDGYMLLDTIVFPVGENYLEISGYRFDHTIFGLNIQLGQFTERVYLYTDSEANHVCNLVKSIDAVNYHSTSMNVSEWDWVKNNGLFTLNSTSNLVNRQSTHAVELFENTEWTNRTGQPMPNIHPSKSSTYCNLFATDLTRDILFPGLFQGNIWNDKGTPWGGNQRANILHYRINKNANKVFVRVKMDGSDRSYDNISGKTAWDYTEAGYVVYLTAFNQEMSMDYLNQPSEAALAEVIKDRKYGSGHIATCYNADADADEGEVIQAGTTTDVLKWTGAQTAHVYLGYILSLE